MLPFVVLFFFEMLKEHQYEFVQTVKPYSIEKELVQTFSSFYQHELGRVLRVRGGKEPKIKKVCLLCSFSDLQNPQGDLDGKACAAVGQSSLMALYDIMFSQVHTKLSCAFNMSLILSLYVLP